MFCILTLPYVNTMHFKDLSYPQFFRVQECIGPELQLSTSIKGIQFEFKCTPDNMSRK